MYLILKIMLEYFKNILLKVSFDQRLFEKELFKATKSLLPKELSELRTWCYSTFSNEYLETMEKFFNNFSN